MPILSVEIWKSIPGYENRYEISTRGRVKSYFQNRIFLLRPGLSSNGYETVALRQKTFVIHELVSLVFIGPRPAGLQICHKDGNRKNSTLNNLYYGTPKENRADADRHGTSCRGEKYSNAKLSNKKVKFIRKNRGKISQKNMAHKFKVSPAAIQAVHDRRTWTHV